MKVLYVAPRMRKWTNLPLQLWGIEGTEDLTRVQAPKGVPGLLLVFDSMEDLNKVYPDFEEKDVLKLTYKEEEDADAE